MATIRWCSNRIPAGTYLTCVCTSLINTLPSLLESLVQNTHRLLLSKPRWILHVCARSASHVCDTSPVVSCMIYSLIGTINLDYFDSTIQVPPPS